jgi:type II secretory pathway component PulF
MPLELEDAPNIETPLLTRPAFGGVFEFKRKVRAKDRQFLIEQLALLLETGTPLHNALQMLEKQADNPAMAVVIREMSDDISSGQTFSRALAKHPSVFSTTYVNLVAASETGGFMHEVLTQLLEEEEKRDRLRATMISALSYPAFLVAFSVAVVVFVLVVVFPKFGEMFAQIQDQLPPTTVALMWLSDFLRGYWLQFLVALAAVGVLSLRWAASSAGAARMDLVKLTMPVIRDVYTQLYLVQTLRIMSLSLSHGVSVVDTLEACRDVIANSRFRAFLARVQRTVQEGGTISAGFDTGEFIPLIVRQMVNTGETTGNLGKVLGRIADYYERELGKKLTAISKMAEPVMLLIMGVLVGVLVSSLILPIFKLSSAVN